ncbi:MAG TPA: cache domain-containing protein [Geobacteraceae bacterium]|nr:cache domain-containing protein [Geobacteraceae bacterium]
MTKFSILPLRVQLLLLALLLAIPAMGIIIYSGLKVRANDYRAAVIESQKLADSLADTQENITREARQFAGLLAELPEVQSGRSDHVQSILTKILKNNPQYQNILIADASGNVWASAIPINKGYSVADRLYFKAARTTLRFSAGEYVVSRSTSKPTLHMATPLVSKGKFNGTVILSIDLDVMRSILGRSQLPANANYILADRSGIIISRGKALGENVGNPIKSDDLRKMEKGPDRHSYEFTRKDGERRIVTYRKLRLEGEQAPYMYVRAGMSLKEAVGAANRQLFYNLATLTPFVILSCMIVIFIGKRSIADRVEKLQEAAHRIADGDLDVRVAPLVQGGEFGELAIAFDHMANRLAENLTEIRQAQHQIKRLNADLEQKVARRTAQLEALLKEQEAFSYTVSHDLRAPLRHISGFSAILNEELGDTISPQCRSYLQRIDAASFKMGGLIDALLEFSRINREEMNLEMVDLGKIAAEIVVMLSETEPEREVEVVIADDLAAKVDATLLRMALQNLLGNSWKYTSKKPAARIELGKTMLEGEEVFFVRDNGVGFDMAYKDKLFAVFQRLHGGDYEGTGIGLATVERIIQRHGGRIWAEGKVGEGAIFYFTLPNTAARSTISG